MENSAYTPSHFTRSAEPPESLGQTRVWWEYDGETFSMEDLGVREDPSHIDRDKNKFFQILMTSICDYVCIYNIPNPTVVYSDPSEAIIFNKYNHM